MKNVLGHHALSQLVMEDTWSRTVNLIKLSSRIDHVYSNMPNQISNLQLVNNAYSDHEMVLFEFTNGVSLHKPDVSGEDHGLNTVRRNYARICIRKTGPSKFWTLKAFIISSKTNLLVLLNQSAWSGNSL